MRVSAAHSAEPRSATGGARAIAHVAHDVALTAESGELPAVSIPCLPVAGSEATRSDLEDVARQTRAAFGLPSGPVRNVVETIENHGLIVIRLPPETSDVDAFSLPFHDRPVVVLGADKNDRARSRFDAAHELGHLVTHGDQVRGLRSRPHRPEVGEGSSQYRWADRRSEHDSSTCWLHRPRVGPRQQRTSWMHC
jgi:hypothetical protein